MRLLLLLLLLLIPTTAAAADWRQDVRDLAGADATVYVVDAEGQVLLDIGGARSFLPASTLKVITTLLAAEYLGLDSRFETPFYLDGATLIVAGQGDPYLVSEELDLVAQGLKAALGGAALDGVRVDDSFFAEGIDIPGVGGSEEPYDALNSATAVNFNTINVQVQGGVVTSAESQTPLTPVAERAAKKRGVKGKLRVNLSDRPEDVRLYAAELIAAKLRAAGVEVGDLVGEGSVPEGAEPIYVHRNSRTVGEVAKAMLYYSTNYIANQLFLAVGAKVEGAPASLDKSVAVARRWIEAHPELAGLVVTEGSGISYDNRATGPAMAAALKLIEPHKDLLRVRHGTAHKTGTLKVTKTVAGFLDTARHGTVRYVVALGAGGSQRRWDIVERLKRAL